MDAVSAAERSVRSRHEHNLWDSSGLITSWSHKQVVEALNPKPETRNVDIRAGRTQEVEALMSGGVQPESRNQKPEIRDDNAHMRAQHTQKVEALTAAPRHRGDANARTSADLRFYGSWTLGSFAA